MGAADGAEASGTDSKEADAENVVVEVRLNDIPSDIAEGVIT